MFTSNVYGLRCEELGKGKAGLEFTKKEFENQADRIVMCTVITAEHSSNLYACKADERGNCSSICGRYNGFEKQCMDNKACQWHPYDLVHSCREREGGFDPASPNKIQP